MKTSTSVVMRVVDYESEREYSKESGPASSTIVPRVGEIVEMEVYNDENRKEDVIFEVVGVGHKYSSAYRNQITLLVKKISSQLCNAPHV